jgi:hypothetical protein
VTHKKVEDGRVAVRSCRHEAMATLEKMKKDKQISEDDLKRGKDRLQKITDAHIAKVEQVGANKEQEILEEKLAIAKGLAGRPFVPVQAGRTTPLPRSADVYAPAPASMASFHRS